MVHQLESYANTSLTVSCGLLWYNISDGIIVCLQMVKTNGSNWSALPVTSAGGVTTFGNIAVTGRNYL